MAQQGSAQAVGNQVVGNIGMYYAAYRLSQQGWNVMPTARNARGTGSSPNSTTQINSVRSGIGSGAATLPPEPIAGRK
jgi:hypothetical protein